MYPWLLDILKSQFSAYDLTPIGVSLTQGIKISVLFISDRLVLG
ncbi:hypothetical protein [Scytonema sp. NUACC21]